MKGFVNPSWELRLSPVQEVQHVYAGEVQQVWQADVVGLRRSHRTGAGQRAARTALQLP